MSALPYETTVPPPPYIKLSALSTTEDDTPKTALDPTKDARQIVRLGQCSQCSYFLDEPITLPCGNTLCKKCLPQSHPRKDISYPATANRLQGFACPFTACRQEHAIGDCSVDVVLKKILGLVHAEMKRHRGTGDPSKSILQVQEKDHWSVAGVPNLCDDTVNVRTSSEGRLAALYSMVEMGELKYDSEVGYTNLTPDNGTEMQDAAMLGRLKKLAKTELDCQVCYGLFLAPVTLTCGHTFCRKCLHRILDHSHLCPVCRRQISLAASLTQEAAPTNKLFANTISAFWPEALAARAAATLKEEKVAMGGLDTALFICTLSFPAMPTFLHIFEPRYRLMIRRAVESGDGKFGMLLHNPSHSPQGELGRVPFYQYGTLLQILNMEIMPDGRSLIETVGVSRFRVIKHGKLDGYIVGKVERIDDISLAAEEAIEAAEVRPSSPAAFPTTIQDPFIHHDLPTPPSSQESAASIPQSPWHAQLHSSRLRSLSLDLIPTKDLLKISVEFVQKMQAQSAPWLHSRVCQAYGACPVDDPKLFLWWFASVLPAADEQRYKLLATKSVRQRLQICVGWIRVLEVGTRWNPSFCPVG